MKNAAHLLSTVGKTSAWCAGALLAGMPSLAEADPVRPNIVLIMSDDQSARELGCYGHPEHRTPVLDELARTGVQFDTAWATPLCRPSRALIMTGRYGVRTGWFHNQMIGGDLSESHRTFAHFLRDAGYATAIVGKWHLLGTEEAHGFDEHCMHRMYDGFDGPVATRDMLDLPGMQRPGSVSIGVPSRYWHPAIVRNGEPLSTGPDDYGPDLFVDFAIDFMERHQDQPFLLYYPMVLPHKAIDFERMESSVYVDVPERDAAGNRTGGRVRGSIQSNSEYIDFLIGRIVAHLEESGLRDRTVIIYTSDNGTARYGKGHLAFERGSHVPLIVNGFGVKARGRVGALTDFSDILPTLCDLAGVPIPEDYVLDGHSFGPVLRGKDDRGRDWIFSYFAGYRFLRDHRWLLDGRGRFFDCGDERWDHDQYIDVTGSDDPEVVAARARFDGILKHLPAPEDTRPGR